MSQIVPQAKLVGRSIALKTFTVHEVLCPECHCEQWWPHGAQKCIYCGTTFTVIPFTVVPPATSPELQEENP